MPARLDGRRRAIAVAMAAGAGLVVAIQSRVSGAFAGEADSPVAAAALSAMGGWLLLSLVVLAVPRLRRQLGELPRRIRVGEVVPWTLLSGALGALLLFSQAAAVPLIGVALYSLLLVSAQTGGGLGVDAAGLGPSGRQPVTANRIAGALLAVVAVGIAAFPDLTGGEFVVGAALVSILAGVGAAFQSAMLGRLGVGAKSPAAAVWVNFTGAAGVLVVVLVVATAAGDTWSVPALSWLWIGGPLGLAVVGLITVAVPVAGVLLVTLALVAGQLFGSLALDLLVPVDGRTPSLWSLGGALLLMAAVSLASRASRVRT